MTLGPAFLARSIKRNATCRRGLAEIRTAYIVRAAKSVAFAWLVAGSCLARSASPAPYDEPYRPQYHFSAAQGWVGDPDGLIHYKNRFSLFWWGKASSTDLVHYVQDAPLVMDADPGNMAYLSGSMVVDRNNTAGFGANAQVAVYTLLDKTTKRQAQGISFSTDGRHFQFFPGNPVLDIGSTEFRDPSVFWHAPSAQWIMAVALAREKTVRFYSSPDLKHWTWMSDFTVPGASQGAWECPDLFELPVDGDPARKKWVLVVSVDWDHEEYFVGDFDGRRFKLADEGADGSPAAAAARYVDRGLDFYASRTFRDYDATLKHTISVGWVASWLYATKVPSSWGKGFWSIPRDLALQTYPDGVRLLQSPVEQLKRLRGAAVARAVPLDAGTTVLSTFKPERNVYEIDATFDTDFPNLFGLDLCVGSGRKVGLRYDSRTHVLTIDRSNSAELPIPGFARQASATVAPVDHRLRLHIYVDKSSMEVFANEGREVFTLLTYAADTQTQIDTFAEQRGTVMDFKAWKLDSIWRKPSKAGGSAARARGAALRVTPGMR